MGEPSTETFGTPKRICPRRLQRSQDLRTLVEPWCALAGTLVEPSAEPSGGPRRICCRPLQWLKTPNLLLSGKKLVTFSTLIWTGLRVCLPLLDTSSYSVYFENIKTALCYLGPLLDYCFVFEIEATWDRTCRYGPSIYTVNEQYIRPVTAEAGMMSWALMRNPDGLDCDLFISHAWQEGVFEFLRKVRHSWPRGVRNAWCCMLANPQNLDIGAMLQTPSDSPFAAALRASKIVLVVPNRHCSVYTRLWCGYEAFLAHEEGKTILIAKDSNLQEIRRLGFAFSMPSVCYHSLWMKPSKQPSQRTDPVVQNFKDQSQDSFTTHCCMCSSGTCARRVFPTVGHSLAHSALVACSVRSSCELVYWKQTGTLWGCLWQKHHSRTDDCEK